MKAIITIALLLLVGIGTNAQEAKNKFQEAMKVALMKWKEAKTPEEIQSVTNTLERIGNAEQNQWLPFYYCALNSVSMAYSKKEAKEIDQLVDKAEQFIERAEELSPENSEIYTLRAMCKGARIMADPMTRAMQYGAESQTLLEKAKQLDPSNPRPYVYQAQSAFYTPEAFGGGKKVAKPIAEKASKLFTEFKPSTPINPDWGLDQIKALLDQCK